MLSVVRHSAYVTWERIDEMPCYDDRRDNPYYGIISRNITDLQTIGRWLVEKINKPCPDIFENNTLSTLTDINNLVSTLCGLLRELPEESLMSLISENRHDVMAGKLLTWWAGHCVADRKRQEREES